VRLAPYGRVAVLSLVMATLYVLATPEHTPTVVRVELFVLTALAAVALLAIGRRRLPPPPSSPFEPPRRPPALSPVPVALERLAAELGAVQPGRPLPAALRRTLRAVAAVRLRTAGVDLDDERQAPAAAARCGPGLWAAIEGQAVAVEVGTLVAALEDL
jgi:hypothetical protein